MRIAARMNTHIHPVANGKWCVRMYVFFADANVINKKKYRHTRTHECRTEQDKQI